MTIKTKTAFVDVLATRVELIEIGEQIILVLAADDADPVALNNAAIDPKYPADEVLAGAAKYLSLFIMKLFDEGKLNVIDSSLPHKIIGERSIPPISVDMFGNVRPADDGIGDADDGLQASVAAVSATIH